MDKDGGVYIVSTAALYRFDAGTDGTPITTWRAVYDDTGVTKPSQKSAGSGTIDRWYWTAMDYRTGRVVYSVLTGTGPFFNNSYASLYLSPSGIGYVGVIGGVVRVEG